MDSGKYDYEKLAQLTALGRLKLLFGSFGSTFLFGALVTLITVPVSLIMYYETSVNRLALEKCAVSQQYEVQDRASRALQALDDTDRTIRELLSTISAPDRPTNRDEIIKQI